MPSSPQPPYDQYIFVRAVLDGADDDAKSTLLEQIAEQMSGRRRSELLRCERHDGHPLFFDWINIEGGLYEGDRIRTEILTTPAAPWLDTRRKFLLRQTDTIFFLYDPEDDRARAAFERARTLLLLQIRRRHRLTVLACTRGDDMSEESVRAALELPEQVPVHCIDPSTTRGARRVLMQMMRASAQLCRERSEHTIESEIAFPRPLLEELQRLEVHPPSSDSDTSTDTVGTPGVGTPDVIVIDELADEDEDLDDHDTAVFKEDDIERLLNERSPEPAEVTPTPVKPSPIPPAKKLRGKRRPRTKFDRTKTPHALDSRELLSAVELTKLNPRDRDEPDPESQDDDREGATKNDNDNDDDESSA